MTLLEEITSGRRPLIVSLYYGGAEREQVRCGTMTNAAALIGSRMAPGWHWSIPHHQWAREDGTLPDYGDPEVLEVLEAVADAADIR